MAGELVSETLGYDGGRQVTVYVPPEPPAAIVFAGDGQLISQWGADMEAVDAPPTMIVGAHRLDDETLRLQEYGHNTDSDWADLRRFTAQTERAGSHGDPFWREEFPLMVSWAFAP